MKSNYSLSEPAARLIYDNLITTIDVSKIDKKALENVKEFQIKFGLLPKEKSPSMDAIYRGVFDEDSLKEISSKIGRYML